MGKYKRKGAWFAYYDKAKIERELEHMAEKGWIIDRLGGQFWRYRKATPQKTHVSVVYVADGSAFDSQPTDGQQQLRELCGETGWRLEASWGQMEIYYNTAEHPIPIETDPVIQVENVHRSMKKNGFRASWGNVAVGLLWTVLGMWLFSLDPAEALASVFQLFLLLGGLTRIAMGVTGLVSGYHWYRRAVEAAEQGVYLEVFNYRAITWVLNIISSILLLMILLDFNGNWTWLLLCILPALAAVWVIGKIVEIAKESGFSRRANKSLTVGSAVVLTLVVIFGTAALGLHFHVADVTRPVGTFERHGISFDVYNNPMPLDLTDLGWDKGMEYSRDLWIRKSPLAARYDYRQWPLTQGDDRPELAYVITEVYPDALMDVCIQGTLDRTQDVVQDGELLWEDHYVETDPTPWAAEKAYQRRTKGELRADYILCYDGRLVELDMSQLPTAEDMAIAAEHLKP